MRKKNILGCILLVLMFVEIGCVFNHKSDSMMRTTASQNTPAYCLAIRGNGDYQPTHWGAMATVVEKLGAPAAMSGGSSSAISMFLLESMVKNPQFEAANADSKKEVLSFLIKSLLEFTLESKNSQWAKDSTLLYKHYKAKEIKLFIKTARKLLAKSKWEDLKNQTQSTAQVIPINEQIISLLNESIQKKDFLQTEFYINEIDNTLKVFGKFDAKNDDNLFFRFGIVSFEKSARLFGLVGGFYSSEGTSEKTKIAWDQLIRNCSPQSIGKSWPEIIKANPKCQNLFADVYKSHFSELAQLPKTELQKAGTKIPVFPSTAILVDDEVERYKAAFSEYMSSRDSRFGIKYKVQNTDQLLFAYWGNKKSLDAIKTRLDMSIEKNKKFYSLGEGSWAEILSLSPAEPGLANLQLFTKDNINYVSAGGWSDLAPTLVLKAHGCENIVYLSRQGGESLFAQGVAKRLLNLDINWGKLDTSNDAVSKMNSVQNDLGDPLDMNSYWSKLYNVANPNSSLRQSLAAANVILCTDWNNHDPKKDLVGAIDSSYRSPFVVSDNSSAEIKQLLQPQLNNPTSGCKY